VSQSCGLDRGEGDRAEEDAVHRVPETSSRRARPVPVARTLWAAALADAGTSLAASFLGWSESASSAKAPSPRPVPPARAPRTGPPIVLRLDGGRGPARRHELDFEHTLVGRLIKSKAMAKWSGVQAAPALEAPRSRGALFALYRYLKAIT